MAPATSRLFHSHSFKSPWSWRVWKTKMVTSQYHMRGRTSRATVFFCRRSLGVAARRTARAMSTVKRTP